ncbi:solute carrier family 15 member 4-like, partial [Stegodyphus dumicola]|uniref:solute carrier family 15 member 4-like n=1 Tax=Stegodyphus dumicola TaxID=202533 RepID=UPI0015AA5C0C
MASDSETEPLLRSVNSLSYSSSDYITARNTNSSRVSSIPSNSRWHFVPGVIILILVLLERIAYYSLTGNLYLFLNKNDFCWESNNAISALLIFTGISYLSCLFGGWLSDAYLGRFRTIGPAFVLFTAAYWFLPYLSELCSMSDNCFSPIINSTNDGGLDIPLYEENCSWLIMCVLIAAAIGTGTVKANITPFGAEQVRYSGTNGLRIYLNWLYWCVNIGALIAILGITYIQQDFKSRDLMYKGFKYGYIIPAALLCCATFLFWFTFPFYTHQSASGSSISRIFSVLKDAWKINRANKGVRKRLNESSSLAAINKPSWLDMAKVRFGGKFHESAVEDVKSLSTIIIVFISLIPYWMLYFQMQSTFLAQGLQMRLSFQSANSTSSDDQKFS